MYRAKIYVTLKKSVFDPQGETVLSALHSLDFAMAKSLRVGRYFEMECDATSEQDVQRQITAMCDRLLVNPVIEDYHFDIEKSE